MGLFRRRSSHRTGTERRISFLVSPSWGARTVHWSLPVWGARLGIGVAVVILLSIALGVGRFGMLLVEAREADSLREENAALRQHYQKLVSLEAELAYLSEELAQIRRLAGLEVYEGSEYPEDQGDNQEDKPE